MGRDSLTGAVAEDEEEEGDPASGVGTIPCFSFSPPSPGSVCCWPDPTRSQRAREPRGDPFRTDQSCQAPSGEEESR